MIVRGVSVCGIVREKYRVIMSRKNCSASRISSSVCAGRCVDCVSVSSVWLVSCVKMCSRSCCISGRCSVRSVAGGVDTTSACVDALSSDAGIFSGGRLVLCCCFCCCSGKGVGSGVGIDMQIHGAISGSLTRSLVHIAVVQWYIQCEGEQGSGSCGYVY